MNDDPTGLSCIPLYNFVEPHGGCRYVQAITGSPYPVPDLPCGRTDEDGLFIVVPLPNSSAAVKVPVCTVHARIIQELHGGPFTVTTLTT